MHSRDSNKVWTPDDIIITRKSLGDRIAKWTNKKGRHTTQIPDFTLSQYDTPTQLTHYMHDPSLCLVAQGAKRVLLGKEIYTYDAYHFLITSVNLPVVAQVIEASREKPFLGLFLKLNRRLIAEMFMNSDVRLPRSQQAGRAMAVSEVTLPILDAFIRLIDLLDTPEDIPIISPLVQREILYRLLVGDQGDRLRQMGAAGTQSHQIAQALDWLKENFNRPLQVEELANHARMSASTFHRHFRAVTSMSPLQYQKSLRLHEARRLMLTEHLDAASAAFQVGYESHTQFSREYSRMFGAPPLRDIKSIRQLADKPAS
ncbi:AraC family transcriptional regulator [Solidesulfovibrio sp.]|uniref:AraC family transcriptional regulator n=1 Tax=Solidesulfovibrio sp. TaxID=2910990 RepID=UPI00261E3DF8|nr:AraC family transcriptional regulator [Solidesulfovibrio sp.]